MLRGCSRAESGPADKINNGWFDAEASFLDIGMSSFTALQLRNALVELTGLEPSAVVILEHPTPKSLVAYLHAELVPTAAV